MMGFPQRSLLLCLVLALLVFIPHGAQGAASKSTRQIRLRGQHQQQQRELETTMFENTEAQYHLLEHYKTALVDPRGPETDPEPAVVETEEKMVEKVKAKTEEKAKEKAEEKVKPKKGKEEEFKPVEPMKEEPKGLYAKSKTSKPKASKVKGGKNGSGDSSSSVEEPKDMTPGESSSDEKPEPPSGKDEKDDTEEPVDMDPLLQEESSAYISEAPSSKDTPPAKDSGKGKGKEMNKSSPEMTEIKVGFEYRLKSEVEPTNEQYAELAKVTSHMFDYRFRSYFMDIEEVEFLSTDRLSIYDVQAPTYVEFTIAAYFDGDRSLPSDSQLTDISSVGLRSGSPTYDYYMFMLQDMDASNPFQSVTSISFYSQTSLLSGPEVMNPQGGAGNHNAIYKVVIPIVLLLVVSVVGAMIYMSWVESHSILEEQEELNLTSPKAFKKKESKDDGEQTLPSDVDRSFSDDGTTMSENSARFIGDAEYRRRNDRQVQVSPKVLYRTFTPGDFASRVDFEEVSLCNDENNETQETYTPEKENQERETMSTRAETEVTITQAMDGFAQVLNSAPLSANAENSPMADHLPTQVPRSEPTVADQAAAGEPSFLAAGLSGPCNTNRYESKTGDLEDRSCSSIDRTAVVVSMALVEQPSSMEIETTGADAELIEVDNEEESEEDDTEYEEEVISEESEDEYSYNENVVVVDYEEESIEEGVDNEGDQLAVIGEGDMDEANEMPETRKEEEQRPQEATELSDVPAEESGESIDPTGGSAGGNLRDFWEKKSSKQEGNLRDFWEQQSRRKN